MLTAMRDKLSGWITWTIIIGISLIFLMFGIGNYFEDGSPESHSVADVGNESITQNQLTNAVNRLSSQDIGADNAQLRRQALQSLINNRLQVVAAKNIGTGLSTKQLDQIIYQIPAFQENGKFSNEKFNYIVSRNGLSLAGIRNDIADDTLTKQVSYGIAGSTFVLPSEVKNFVDLMSQKRNISQLTISTSEFSKQASISKKEINSYYESHNADFVNPSELNLQYIMLSVTDLEEDIHPSKQNIKQYYDSNATSFGKPESRKYSQITLSLPKNATKGDIEKATTEADKIIAQALKNENFASLVNEFSTDLLAKKDHGNMGWIEERSDLNHNIVNAVFKLAKTGDISKPIITQQGIQIIKLTNIKAGKHQTLKEASPEIIKIIKRQQAEIKYSSIGNSLSNLAFENPQSLSFVAKQLNLKLITTPTFTSKGLERGLMSNKKVLQSAFSDNVLKDRNNSDVINISNTESVVIRVNNYTPPKPKAIADVSLQITKLLKEKKELNLAKQKADNIVKKLNSVTGKEKRTITANFVEIKNISRENKAYPKIVIQSYMSAPLSSKKTPNYRVIKVNDGYAVYAVNKIIADPSSKNDKQKSLAFGQMMKQLYGTYIYQLYLAHITREIPVEIIK